MASAAPKRILIVDDEEVIRNFYRDSLAAKGYSVDSAVDGLDGLGMLWDSVYDLVITDINMPRLDGLGLYESAQIRFPYIKERFLFITGTPPASIEHLYRRKRILLKPFRIDELFDMVERLTGTPLDEQLEQAPLNRRHARRVMCHGDCYMIPEGSMAQSPVVAARTQDISSHGLRVRYFGDSVRPGDRVRLRISGADAGMELRKEGRVVWARGLNHVVCAGVTFTEPIPDALIDTLGTGFLPPGA